MKRKPFVYRGWCYADTRQDPDLVVESRRHPFQVRVTVRENLPRCRHKKFDVVNWGGDKWCRDCGWFYFTGSGWLKPRRSK